MALDSSSVSPESEESRKLHIDFVETRTTIQES